ncbi:MAG TPA: hypothetical protein VLV54_15470 [Thermoanaerobaculia bacterium]|nr:hypothetical protein [Thermoanaerobaculia bacterium]
MMHSTTPSRVSGFLVLTLVLLLSRAPGATAEEKPDFLELQRSLALLVASPVAQQEPNRQAVTKIRDLVEDFQALLEESEPSPDGHTAETVHYLSGLLGEVASGEAGAQSGAVLDDIRRDLELKVQYFRGRMGVAGATRGLVLSTVRTLHQGKPVMGLAIYCNPYRWKDEARPMRTFPEFSSPTTRLIMPGYYRCFAAAGAPAKRIASRDVEIGLGGEDKVTFNIEVPR